MQRDPHDCIIAGVCSGLAQQFDLNTMLLRLLFVFLFLWFGAGPLLYVILWILTPKRA